MLPRGQQPHIILSSAGACMPDIPLSHSPPRRFPAQRLGSASGRVLGNIPPQWGVAAAASEAGDLEGDMEEEEIVLPTFNIIYQDEHVIAIDKPAGTFAHRPEDGFPIPIIENCMYCLSEQLGGKYLYPGHRLDRATSGVLVYCTTREAASGFGRMARERMMNKTYLAMVRGYADPEGIIESDIDGYESLTEYQTLAKTELKAQVGKYSSARYSLLKVTPKSGRTHQIRRHLNRIARPIVNDTDHGDRAHNRFFAGPMNIQGMYLKCVEMSFTHPAVAFDAVDLSASVDDVIVIRTRAWEPRWLRAFDMFGLSASEVERMCDMPSSQLTVEVHNITPTTFTPVLQTMQQPAVASAV